jgi:hypothetical protein
MEEEIIALAQSEDAIEGRRAFMEKRTAVWTRR